MNLDPISTAISKSLFPTVERCATGRIAGASGEQMTPSTDNMLRATTAAHPAPVRCIWCGVLADGREPCEHIVPEAIGCPDGLVLDHGEVCARCNHGLAHLDQALAQDLELYAFMAGVPRKGGKPPSITSHGNVRAELVDGKQEWHFNMGTTPVVGPKGSTLPGFRGRERDLRADFSTDGTLGRIDFKAEFGRNPKVARALVKMATEYLCFVAGPHVAADTARGVIAEFVCKGRGYRPVLLHTPDETKYEHEFGTVQKVSPKGYACHFRLAHSYFAVDLSPELSAFAAWAQSLYVDRGGKGWTTLPLDAVDEQSGRLIVRMS